MAEWSGPLFVQPERRAYGEVSKPRWFICQSTTRDQAVFEIGDAGSRRVCSMSEATGSLSSFKVACAQRRQDMGAGL